MEPAFAEKSRPQTHAAEPEAGPALGAAPRSGFGAAKGLPRFLQRFTTSAARTSTDDSAASQDFGTASTAEAMASQPAPSQSHAQMYGGGGHDSPQGSGGESSSAAPQTKGDAAGLFNVISADFNPVGNPVAGLLSSTESEVESGGMRASAVVETKNKHDESRYQVGYLQTLVKTRRMAIYKHSRYGIYRTLTIEFGPAMDRAHGTHAPVPWYDQPVGFKAEAPTMQDVPSFRNSIYIPTGNSTLTALDGAESFITYLIARPVAGGAPIFLRWCTWSVNWAGTFSANYQQFSGGQSQITGCGAGKYGTPVVSGLSANKLGAAARSRSWSGPSLTAPSNTAPSSIAPSNTAPSNAAPSAAPSTGSGTSAPTATH